MRDKSRLGTIRGMLRFLAGDRTAYLFGLTGLGLINLLLNMAFAWLLAFLTTQLTESQPIQNLGMVVSLVVLGTIALSLLSHLAMRSMMNSVANIIGRIRHTVLTHVLSLPLASSEIIHSGTLLSLLNNDVLQAGNLYLAGFQKLVSSGITGVGAAVSVLLIDWRIGLFAIASGACSLLGGFPFIKPLYAVGKGVQSAKASWLAGVSDLTGGISAIRSFGREQQFELEIEQLNQGWLQCASNRVSLEATRATVGNILYTVHLLFLAYGAYLSVQEPAILPGFVSIMHLQNPIRGFFASLAEYLGDIQVSLAASRRVLDSLALATEQSDESQRDRREGLSVQMEPPATDEIGLAAIHLTYSHAAADKPVIEHLSFCTPPTGILLVSGPSGRGKTTLLKLILGLYRLSGGSLSYCGYSLADLDQEGWRSLFSYIPQDKYVFSGTVYENIVAGAAATEADVANAAGMANADAFIAGLPLAYDTQVLADGNEFSLGQQQRLAIARAIVQNRPIIVMDEPTSALDSESEQLIQESIIQLSKSKLVIIATHSDRLLNYADVIVSL